MRFPAIRPCIVDRLAIHFLLPFSGRKSSDPTTARSNRIAAAIEPLETRRLLSVSVSQQIAPVTLSTSVNSTTLNLGQNFTDPQTSGTFVDFQTSLGTVEVQLFDKDTPLTVANFLHYANQGLYNNTIIHRSVPGFVVQGGGFTTTGTAIQTFAPVQNEPVFSNVLGTIAMAKVAGNPNSATSQYFFNAADNSSTLDNQNGGFTVFGDVVQGLNVVEAINKLSTTSATLGGNSFTDLPLVSATAGTAPSNLVDVSSVATVAAPLLQITAVSDNTRLVTTSVSGENLSLSAVPGQTGFAHVTVTATGPSGTSVTQVVRVHVVGAQTVNVPLGLGNARSVSFRDQTGNSGTLSISGPGSVAASFSGSNIVYRGGAVHGENVELDGLTVTGTTSASSIAINGPASRQRSVAVGDISITGSASQIQLHHALLLGDLTASGSVRKLVVDSAEDGKITIGSGSPLSFQGTSLANESLTSAAPIAKLDAASWVNADPAVVITAPSIQSVVSKGDLIVGLDLSAAARALGAINVRGYIGGNWTVPGKLPDLRIGGIAATFNGTFANAIPSLRLKLNLDGNLSVPSIGQLSVKGDVTGGVLRLTAPLTSGGTDLKKLTVKGQINNAAIVSTGNIGSISARGIVLADIFAGVAPLQTNEPLPTTESEFSGHASIGSITTRGIKKGLGYSASNIAAWTVGKLELGTTATKNQGVTFGVAGHTIGVLSVTDTSKKQTFSFSHVTSAATLASEIAAKKLTLNDLHLSIL